MPVLNTSIEDFLSSIQVITLPYVSLHMTVADAMAANLSPVVQVVQTQFFDNNFQSNSGARYRRMNPNVEPTHPLKFQSANGLWFALDEIDVRPEMIGGGPNLSDNYAAFASCFSYLKAKGGTASLVLRADKTYKVSSQNFDTSHFGKFISIRSDILNVEARIDFSDRTTWTGYSTALFDMAGSLVPATLQLLTEDMDKPEARTVASGTAVGSVCTLVVGTHNFVAGNRVYINSLTSTSSLVAGDRGYLTMRDSDEGMSPTVPVEITSVTALSITYTSNNTNAPGATLVAPTSISVIANSNICHVASTAAFKDRDLVYIRSNDIIPTFSGGVVTEVAEQMRVKRIIDATRMEVERSVHFSFKVASSGSVQKINPVRIFMQDIRVKSRGYNPNPGQGTFTDIGIRHNFSEEAVFRRVVTENCGYYGNMAQNAYAPLHEDCRCEMEEYNRQGLATGYFEYTYGFGNGGTTVFARYIRCKGVGGRHQNTEVTTSDMEGMVLFTYIEDWVGQGSLYGSISTHDLYAKMTVRNATFINCGQSLDIRNGDFVATGVKIYGGDVGVNLNGMVSNVQIEIEYAEQVRDLISIVPSTISPAIAENISILIKTARDIDRVVYAYARTNKSFRKLRVIGENIDQTRGVLFNLSAQDATAFYDDCFVDMSGSMTNASFVAGRASNVKNSTFQNITPAMSFSGVVYPIIVSQVGATPYGNNTFRNCKAQLSGSATFGDISIPSTSKLNKCDTIGVEFVTPDGTGLVVPQFVTTQIFAIMGLPITLRAISNIPNGQFGTVRPGMAGNLTVADSAIGNGSFQTTNSADQILSGTRSRMLFQSSSAENCQVTAALPM